MARVLYYSFLFYALFFFSLKRAFQFQRLIAFVFFWSRFQTHRRDFHVISIDSVDIFWRFKLRRRLTDIVEANLRVGRHRTREFSVGQNRITVGCRSQRIRRRRRGWEWWLWRLCFTVHRRCYCVGTLSSTYLRRRNFLQTGS